MAENVQGKKGEDRITSDTNCRQKQGAGLLAKNNSADSGEEDRRRQRRKLELREKNQAAWNGIGGQLKLNSALDSSLKKNTAFIRRLRTGIVGDAQAQLLSDVCGLSLEKYLLEIVSAVVEGLAKSKLSADVLCAVEVVSALHQRFAGAFTGPLTFQLAKGLAMPPASYLQSLAPEQKEREEAARLVRQRCLLRVATELWLVGILRTLDDAQDGTGKAPLPLDILRDLLGRDSEFVNVPLVTSFVKAFAVDVLSENGGLVEDATRGLFRNGIVKYFSAAKAQCVKQHRAIKWQEKRNMEAYIKSGEMFEDRQAAFEKSTKALERFTSNLQSIAEILNLEMPDLAAQEDETQMEGQSIIKGSGSSFTKSEEDADGIWEDEEAKRFYEVLVDLKLVVPKSALNIGDDSTPADLQQKPKPETNLLDATENLSDDETETDEPEVPLGAKIEALLNTLPSCGSRDLVDKFAVDFCFVNNKAARARLAKTLIAASKSKQDILSYYARLIATYDPYFKDVSRKVIEEIVKEFRRLHRGRGGPLEVRGRNVRYLAELTKFNILPFYVIFFCLKVLVDGFSRHHIETLAIYLESCGRFLFRNPQTRERMQVLLSTLSKKKEATNVGVSERTMIENAMYYCNPPARSGIVAQKIDPSESYLAYLLYKKLNKLTIKKTVKQLRLYAWKDPEVLQLMLTYFTNPWMIRFDNIQYLAVVVGGMAAYYPEFHILVVDTICEYIRVGLELNYFELNQKRIAHVKYLAELYNFQLVDTTTFIDTLYLILTFGYEEGRIKYGSTSTLDPPDDYFRVRMVCTILETSGLCFDKGKAKIRFEKFLAYFQFYLFNKAPMPVDVNFLVQDTFSRVRPNWKMAETPLEAATHLDSLLMFNSQLTAKEDEEDDSDSSLEAPDVDGVDSGGEVEADSASDSTESDLVDEEADPLDDRRNNEVEEDEDFERDFAQLMSDTGDGNIRDRKSSLNLPLPMSRVSQPTSDGFGESHVAFTFMTRKNNKPQAQRIGIPENSDLAITTRQKLLAQKDEQQKIKSRVLNYEKLEQQRQRDLSQGKRKFIWFRLNR